MKKTPYSCFEKKERSRVNPVKFIRRLGRNIRNSYQRIRYGYCDRDVWEIDDWFLNVVPNMLRDLKETNHGFPIRVGEMVGCDNRNYDEAKQQEAIDKWDSILSEMIFYLQEANPKTCQKMDPDNKDTAENADDESKLSQYRNECKNKGLQLFSEWFWELWD